MKRLGAWTRAPIGRGLVARLFGRGLGPGRFQTSSAVLDHYVAGMPSLQNAIDSVPGWVGEMPPETGLVAGDFPLYTDTRIEWLLSECFAAAGTSVLELGPLEAFHTYMLQNAGAASIDGIEANTLAYVRCLVTKEALKLDRANFYLGDFMKWLEHEDKKYDLVVASGVLYHSHDPVRLLELICERADSFYLWTHYFDEVAMPRGDLRRVPFSERVETKECRGVNVRLHERSYYKAWRDPAFCGGIQDRHFWIDRQDILDLITAFGFEHVRIADEEPAHLNGPSFSVFGTRRPPAPVATGPVAGALPDASPADVPVEPEVPVAPAPSPSVPDA